MANDRWSGLTPEQDEKWEQFWDKYVPGCGKADSLGGEVIRAMARIIYRFYNDGDMVGIGYGNETVNSSDRYLSRTVPGYESLDGIMFESKYEETMLSNHRKVFKFVENEAAFHVPNSFDSRDASHEDYERARQDYEEYWEEEEE